MKPRQLLEIGSSLLILVWLQPCVTLGEEKPAPSSGLAAIEKIEPTPTEVPRGGVALFTGHDLPKAGKDILVFLDGEQAGQAFNASQDGTWFQFSVPDEAALGKHRVQVRLNQGNPKNPQPIAMPADATLTVLTASGKLQPKITAIEPVLSYPEKRLYGFEVIGEGFSNRGQDNGLIIGDREVRVCWEGGPCKEKDAVHGQIVSSRQLSFTGIHAGPLGTPPIQIRVGQERSDPFPITLSRVERGIPLELSLGILALLTLLVFVVIRSGMGEYRIDGRMYGFLKTLLVDKETDTYSLSRLQLYLWTAAAIFGYLYLSLSRSLVQWKLDFMDIPPGLPGIILISASTGFLAQGIQSAKGPKGSGNKLPSASDFITSGGVVAPERFQFFVWTILGIVTFLTLVILQDPGNIKDLPTIPTGFLELMGVSSVGYLGGKLARKPGPVIDEIVAEMGSLVLTIKGRNLSQDASFQIGGEDVTSDLIESKPEILEKDGQSDEPNMAKSLKLSVKSPKDPWVKGDQDLTIINPDGQKAVWAYAVKDKEKENANS